MLDKKSESAAYLAVSPWVGPPTNLRPPCPYQKLNLNLNLSGCENCYRIDALKRDGLQSECQNGRPRSKSKSLRYMDPQTDRGTSIGESIVCGKKGPEFLPGLRIKPPRLVSALYADRYDCAGAFDRRPVSNGVPGKLNVSFLPSTASAIVGHRLRSLSKLGKHEEQLALQLIEIQGGLLRIDDRSLAGEAGGGRDSRGRSDYYDAGILTAPCELSRRVP